MSSYSYPEPSRCRLLLLGTSEYRSPDLPGIPAVQRNLASLRAVLTDGTNATFPPRPMCVWCAATRARSMSSCRT